MRSGQRAEGSSLIEVLVSIVVASVGLLGLAALHLHGLRVGQTAYQHGQAVLLADDILERMRANANVAAAYVVDFGSISASTQCEQGPSDSSPPAACSENAMATFDKASWKSSLASSLPSGDGKVTAVGAHAYSVTVCWDATHASGETLTGTCGATESSGWSTFTMTSEL